MAKLTLKKNDGNEIERASKTSRLTHTKVGPKTAPD